MKGSHTEESKHFTVITVYNRPLRGSRSFCMQRDAVFCHAFVQSVISQGFVCFFYYRWLELGDLSAHDL